MGSGRIDDGGEQGMDQDQARRPRDGRPKQIPPGPSLPSNLICYSHLRWDFVFQRPQHLMPRMARQRRVFFVEDPIPADTAPTLEVRGGEGGVLVVTPRLSAAQIGSVEQRREVLGALLTQ